MNGITLNATLDQAILEQLVRQYFVDEGFPVEHMDVSINLVAGRGGNGNRAEVTMSPKKKEKPVVKAEPKVESIIEPAVDEEEEVVESVSLLDEIEESLEEVEGTDPFTIPSLEELEEDKPEVTEDTPAFSFGGFSS